jgi:acetylornithine deacetylase
MTNGLLAKIRKAVLAQESDTICLLRELIRIPSVNHPPGGDEDAVQIYYHQWLRRHGIDGRLVYPEEIPAFASHPAHLLEHDMAGRPNVIAEMKGTGNGRSLLILAHADTEPVGERSSWSDDPFSGVEREGKILGRGAGDDKAGMAIAATLPQVFRQDGIKLLGDLTVAAVADEEQGGGNGVAALLADGVTADAALYLDGSNQKIWNVGLGGGCCFLTLPKQNGERPSEDIERAKIVIREIKDGIRRAVVAHPDFGEAFFLNDLSQGFHNIGESETESGETRLSFFLDMLPGENEAELKQAVESRLRAKGFSRVDWISRFLPPAPRLAADHPLVASLAGAFVLAVNRKALVRAGRQSDQGLVSRYGKMPCVLFGCGRRGLEGAPHLPNEYVLVDELRENLLTAALFAANWCGVEVDG